MLFQMDVLQTSATRHMAAALSPPACINSMTPDLTPCFTLKNVLRELERQVSEFQKQQRLRDFEAELEHSRRQLVDIQVCCRG